MQCTLPYLGLSTGLVSGLTVMKLQFANTTQKSNKGCYHLGSTHSSFPLPSNPRPPPRLRIPTATASTLSFLLHSSACSISVRLAAHSSVVFFFVRLSVIALRLGTLVLSAAASSATIFNP
ncbi:unnamed protein product [Sphenostylis stenocarpa]|uniref:Uncharacterized protein n=1 Tax=Sphenostylis stenocarpa TaxID=92480 RepID=A0AA86SEX9_9FABA|nr:unnamed protein product [Sphenostylis stenocarpa]